jgi:DNA gyrase/topoisomerase IV subunit A
MHSLKEDDGRYNNKVANVVGHTMQHHGDASIVIYGANRSKELIDCQGTVESSQTAQLLRYIEASLSKFALKFI